MQEGIDEHAMQEGIDEHAMQEGSDELTEEQQHNISAVHGVHDADRECAEQAELQAELGEVHSVVRAQSQAFGETLAQHLETSLSQLDTMVMALMSVSYDGEAVEMKADRSVTEGGDDAADNGNDNDNDAADDAAAPGTVGKQPTEGKGQTVVHTATTVRVGASNQCTLQKYSRVSIRSLALADGSEAKGELKEPVGKQEELLASRLYFVKPEGNAKHVPYFGRNLRLQTEARIKIKQGMQRQQQQRHHLQQSSARRLSTHAFGNGQSDKLAALAGGLLKGMQRQKAKEKRYTQPLPRKRGYDSALKNWVDLGSESEGSTDGDEAELENSVVQKAGVWRGKAHAHGAHAREKALQAELVKLKWEAVAVCSECDEWKMSETKCTEYCSCPVVGGHSGLQHSV
jgi:hypothetical protein